MKESTTYQKILREGPTRDVRRGESPRPSDSSSSWEPNDSASPMGHAWHLEAIQASSESKRWAEDDRGSRD